MDNNDRVFPEFDYEFYFLTLDLHSFSKNLSISVKEMDETIFKLSNFSDFVRSKFEETADRKGLLEDKLEKLENKYYLFSLK